MTLHVEEGRVGPCPDCGDTRIVYVNDHAADCVPIRCSNACPVRKPRVCERCERAELSETLA